MRIRPFEALETAIALGKEKADPALFWYFVGMVSIYCPVQEQVTLLAALRKIPKADADAALEILQNLNPAVLMPRSKDHRERIRVRATAPKPTTPEPPNMAAARPNTRRPS